MSVEEQMISLVEEIRDLAKEGIEFLRDKTLKAELEWERERELSPGSSQPEEEEIPSWPLHDGGTPHSNRCPCKECRAYHAWFYSKGLPRRRIEYSAADLEPYTIVEAQGNSHDSVVDTEDTPKLDQEKALHPEVYTLCGVLSRTRDCPPTTPNFKICNLLDRDPESDICSDCWVKYFLEALNRG